MSEKKEEVNIKAISSIQKFVLNVSFGSVATLWRKVQNVSSCSVHEKYVRLETEYGELTDELMLVNNKKQVQRSKMLAVE